MLAASILLKTEIQENSLYNNNNNKNYHRAGERQAGEPAATDADSVLH